MDDRKIDYVSFVRAREAQDAAAIANGDISSVMTMISGMQQQLSDLTDAVNALDTLYHAHSHAYTDIDNTGATLNKTTNTPA